MDADLDTFVTALYVTIDDALRMRPELRQRRPSIGLVPKTLGRRAVAPWPCSKPSWASPLRHGSCAMPRCICGPGSPTSRTSRATTSACARPQVQLRAIDPHSRGRHRALGRRHLDHGFDAGRVWAFASDRPAQRPGRVGLLRLLRQPLALVLGAAAPPRVHPGRPAASPSRWPIRRSTSARWPGTSSRPSPRLLRPGQRVLADKGYRSKELEAFLGRPRRRAPPTRPQERPRPHDQPAPQALAPAHRIGQRHAQDPARPRTSRRQNPRWRGHRVLQRLLALTAAIWHNSNMGQRPLRSLVAFDHG